jgi:hypothetical protein
MKLYPIGAMFVLGMYVAALIAGEDYGFLTVFLGTLLWPITLGGVVYKALRSTGFVP